MAVFYLFATYFAVPFSTGRTLCDAPEDEFPPDDITEDDLVEVTQHEVPERDITGQNEVNVHSNFKPPLSLIMDHSG